MLRYGSDKPDLRYGLEIVELSDVAAKMELPPFRESLEVGGKVRGINARGSAAKFSRKNLDELSSNLVQAGGKMLAWVKVEEGDKVTSSISKFLTPDVQAELGRRFDAQTGDLLLLAAADHECAVCDCLGAMRQQLAQKLALVDPAKKDFKIAW